MATEPVTTLNVEYLRLHEVAAILPRNENGTKISERSIERWIFKGQMGIKLKARKMGRYWVVKKEDLDAFGEQVAARSLGEPVNKPKNIATKLSESTKRRLVAAGLMKPEMVAK